MIKYLQLNDRTHSPGQNRLAFHQRRRYKLTYMFLIFIFSAVDTGNGTFIIIKHDGAIHFHNAQTNSSNLLRHNSISALFYASASLDLA